MLPSHLFADFELDTSLFELRRGEELVGMGPRVFDVLSYLIHHRDRFVSKDELIRHVWEATAMSQSSVPTCIAALRKALGDDPASPRFIETRRGRGYRFVAEVRGNTESVRTPPHFASDVAARDGIQPVFVGRDRELDSVRAAVERALSSAPQLVLIVGEPAIGTTRKTEEFAHSARDDRHFREPKPLTGVRPAPQPGLRSTLD